MLLSLDMFPLYLNNESSITGMVVTDDDHLLLCDHASGKLVTVYYPSGKYMKTIDVSYPPWDIAIINNHTCNRAFYYLYAVLKFKG
jgi:hypothetical protein